MKIALIQQHASADLDDNRRRGVSAFERAAREGVHLIAFAELAFLPFLPQIPGRENPKFREFAQPVPGPLTEEFGALAKRHGIVVVLNLFERSGEETFDSSPVIDADGSLLGTTRMVHIMDGPGFHERDYYAAGDNIRLVYETQAGRIGVAICYDRHFPEYMRGLGLLGAEIVVVPQAGVIDEWGEGLYEGEMRIASFQNGYFTALVNRVGRESVLHFAGESFVADPFGTVIARAPRDADHILYAHLDFGLLEKSHARRHFLPDRRPQAYRGLRLTDKR